MERDGDALISDSAGARISLEDEGEAAKPSVQKAGHQSRKEDKSPLLPKHHVLEPLEVEYGGQPVGTKGTDLPDSGTASISRYCWGSIVFDLKVKHCGSVSNAV